MRQKRLGRTRPIIPMKPLSTTTVVWLIRQRFYFLADVKLHILFLKIFSRFNNIIFKC